jgi:hypothetical protein
MGKDARPVYMALMRLAWKICRDREAQKRWTGSWGFLGAKTRSWGETPTLVSVKPMASRVLRMRP